VVSYLWLLLGDGLLLAVVDVLEAMQQGQQGGAGALGGALVVHLPRAVAPQTQQQQHRRQQLAASWRGDTVKSYPCSEL